MISLRAVGEWKEERKAGVQECVAKDVDEEVDCHVRGLAMTCIWRVYLGVTYSSGFRGVACRSGKSLQKADQTFWRF